MIISASIFVGRLVLLGGSESSAPRESSSATNNSKSLTPRIVLASVGVIVMDQSET